MNRTLVTCVVVTSLGLSACAASTGDEPVEAEPVATTELALMSDCRDVTPNEYVTTANSGWNWENGIPTWHGGSCGWAYIVENQNLDDATYYVGSGIGYTYWPATEALCRATIIYSYWWGKNTGGWAELGGCTRVGSWDANAYPKCSFPLQVGSPACPASTYTYDNIKTAARAVTSGIEKGTWGGVYIP